MLKWRYFIIGADFTMVLRPQPHALLDDEKNLVWAEPIFNLHFHFL